MTEAIATAAEAETLIHRLQQGVWQLAALAVVLRDDPARDPEHRGQAQQVLVELGLMSETTSGIAPSAGLAEFIRRGRSDLAAESAANILQSAGMLSGAAAWASQDDDALLAQGRGSAQGVAAFKMFGLPALAGLKDLFDGVSPQMLDVGVGVAAMPVEYAVPSRGCASSASTFSHAPSNWRGAWWMRLGSRTASSCVTWMSPASKTTAHTRWRGCPPHLFRDPRSTPDYLVSPKPWFREAG
jgi:hypothetical protein